MTKVKAQYKNMATQKKRTSRKSSGIGVGLAVGTAIGAAAGAVAALLLSPKSGKQNRALIARKVKDLRKKLEDTRLDDKVKETFGEVNEETRNIYVGAKEALATKLAEIKDSADIDLKKYTDVVNDVVASAQKRVIKESKKAAKLKDSLMAYFPKVGNKKKAPVKKRASTPVKKTGSKKKARPAAKKAKK